MGSLGKTVDNRRAAAIGGGAKSKILYFRRMSKTGRDWKTYTIPLPPNIGTGKAVAVGDMNGDGVTDGADLGAFLSVFDTACP